MISNGVNPIAVLPCTCYLIQTNEVYISPDFNRMSLTRLEGYLLFSEIIGSLYKGYKWDAENVSMKPSSVPLLDYKEHTDLLLSKVGSID